MTYNSLLITSTKVVADIPSLDKRSLIEDSKPDIFFILLFWSLVGTLILEVPIFYLLGFRKKKELQFVLVVNLISVPLLHLLQDLSPLLIRQPVYQANPVLLLLEIGVVILETIFLKKWIPNKTWKRILLSVLFANCISAFFGSILFALIGF